MCSFKVVKKIDLFFIHYIYNTKINMENTPKFMIIRVGDISENFTRSVLDRMQNGFDLKPIWGYNSNKCGGLSTTSQIRHKKLVSWSNEGNAYLLFLPKNKSSIVGVAKISIGEKRTTTNAENGWISPTAIGDMEWDIEIFIEKYWDVRKIDLLPSIFSYDTLMTIHQKKITQNSLLYFNESESLYQYLHYHVEYIVRNIKPHFENIV